jgi:aromatic-amino-acid transaminase
VLDCVKQAEAQMLAEGGAKSYLPIEGSAAMRSAVQGLLFGAEHPAVKAGRVATLQTVGSSGGLKVGADFIKRWLPASGLWVSDPTWDNHRAMFEGAGVPVTTTRPPVACASPRCAPRSMRCPPAASCCCTRAATTRPAWT